MPHTLLLADDSVTIQRVIELTFADEDVQVIAVSDGDQAIERLEASPPDIVLADIGMPGRNGYEVAQYIKQSPRLAHIPVVLLTGAFEPVDEARASEAGCDGVLAKPFEPQLVIGRVKELLARRRHALEPSAASPSTAPPADHWSPAPPAEILVSAAPPANQALPAQPPARVEALDNYFDRLDAAFSRFTDEPARKPEAPAPPSTAAPVPDEIDWFGAAKTANTETSAAPPPSELTVSQSPAEPPDLVLRFTAFIAPTPIEPEPAAAPAASPEPDSAAVSPEPDSLAVSPEPEPAVAPPEPEPWAASPEPDSPAASLEPELRLAPPEPEQPAASSEPDPPAALLESEPWVAPPEPEPWVAPPEPEPWVAPPEPEPWAVSLGPEPPAPSFEPEPPVASLEPDPASLEPDPWVVSPESDPWAVSTEPVSPPPPVADADWVAPAAYVAQPAPVVHALPSLAEAFAALLAAEKGQELQPIAPRWPASGPSPSPTADEIVEQVTRRVLDRLSDRVVRETVADLVSSIAERLIREEIAQIKSAIK